MADDPTTSLPVESLFRLQFVKAAIELGFPEACAQFHLDPAAIDSWKSEDWYRDLAKQVFAGQAEALDRKMTRMIDKAMAQAEKRLEGLSQTV